MKGLDQMMDKELYGSGQCYRDGIVAGALSGKTL